MTGVTREGPFAGHHLIEDDSERKQIRAVVDRKAAGLFGAACLDDRGGDDIYRADISLNFSFLPWKSVELFVEPQVLNVFNNQNVLGVSTTIQTRANTGSSSFAAFNPFTEQPKQGPAATGGATPTYNWNYASTFGLPTGPGSYQLPRTFRISMGVRF